MFKAGRWLLLLALVVLATVAGCRDETAPGSSGDHDASPIGDSCDADDTDDPGGGCPYGYYCDEDGTCQQDCVNDDDCIEQHGLFWWCNQYGQCEVEAIS